MKTVLITGGNSGIGKATATELAAKGYQVETKNEYITSENRKILWERSLKLSGI